MCPCPKSGPLLAFSALLLGCASVANIVSIGDNAWRVTTVDYNSVEVARAGTAQAVDVCRKQGKVPFVVSSNQYNDMPARYTMIMEFQCTAAGSSPAAQAEARMLGFQRDCAIAGFTIGSPENLKCAGELSAKAGNK